jgi:hypothetical protein
MGVTKPFVTILPETTSTERSTTRFTTQSATEGIETTKKYVSTLTTQEPEGKTKPYGTTKEHVTFTEYTSLPTTIFEEPTTKPL